MQGRRNIILGSLALATSGCGVMKFPVNPGGVDLNQDDRSGEVNVIPVTTSNILAVREPKNTWITEAGTTNNPPPAVRYVYRVGTGDVLQIRFYADPTGIADAADFAPQTTAVVDAGGEFFFPFVGKMQASGLTENEIRIELTERLQEFFTQPQVEVSVAAFNAHQATIVGAVGNPGNRTLTNVPTTMLDLFNELGATQSTDTLGQGASAGDVRRIRLRRHGQEYTVNLVQYIDKGDKRNNPVLLPDDLIIVPENAFNKIYTFGEITNGEVALTGAPKTLVEVLAEQGGINRVRSDARGIFVFRRNEPFQQAFDVYQFDLSNAASLILASDFIVSPLDIVFVTNNPPTRWSDTISTLLQPFNSILSAQITANNLDL